MKMKTIERLKTFNENSEKEINMLKNEYAKYNSLLKEMISGEGMIGNSSYLVLWRKSEITELNDDYAVEEFLNNIILIGSDGGDTAYGMDINGNFIEVPFIGMDDDEVKIISNTFDGFIEYLYNKND